MQANKRRHPKAKPRKRFWSFIRKLVLWCLVMAAIGAAVGYFGFMMAWKRYDKLGRRNLIWNVSMTWKNPALFMTGTGNCWHITSSHIR